MNLESKLDFFFYNYFKNIDNIIFYNKTIPNQKPKKYNGNREYKISLNYHFCNTTKRNNILDKKTTQMIFRLNEGQRKALYILEYTIMEKQKEFIF